MAALFLCIQLIVSPFYRRVRFYLLDLSLFLADYDVSNSMYVRIISKVDKLPLKDAFCVQTSAASSDHLSCDSVVFKD